MKKVLIYVFICSLILSTFLGCQTDTFTDQSDADWELEENEFVDTEGFSGDLNDYSTQSLALSHGEIHIPGRSYLSRFSMTTSLFRQLYNNTNPQHKITGTARSEAFGYDLTQYRTDGNCTMYSLSDVEIAYVYFTYPVAETENSAWDYEKDIDHMLSVFDTFMPTLYDEDNKLSLEYLSKWLDVGSREQQMDFTILEVLRKYLTTSFQIRDGIAYVGIGSTGFPIEENLSEYF